ncbi:ABC transporter permease [Fibrella forsythiae]|uniref:ABC transporter permease n=1 Tax=Fibrella forsythiae TaxID=2817061 RepID=A0ABS3JNN1_9BACT|nr:ABC transporter permease [Fibrella forsythiae]MBO0951103.1 ABC transporter permease [Fibrella forsythiae]
MQTFWQTARFEFRYHLRQPVFYLLYGLMVAQGFFYGLDAVNEELFGLPYSNAPGLFISVFSTVGVLFTALAALLTGQSLLRDRTYRVGDYLYALPLNELLYFAGKLIGVLGTCLLLATGIVLGTLLLPLWVTVPVGPFPLSAILVSFSLLMLPNLLIVVSLAYALTAVTQRMAGAYLALLALVIGQVLLRIGEPVVVRNDLLLLLDPFGHILIRDALSQLTSFEQRSGTLPLPDLLLINRLLWLGLSGGLLVRAANRLTFHYWSGLPSQRATKRDLANPQPQRTQSIPLPLLTRRFNGRASWRVLCQLTPAYFRHVVNQPAFSVVGLLLVLAIIGYATGLGNLTETGQRLLPSTSRMTFVRLPLLFFTGLFLSVFSGELLYRERNSGMWPLVDATPQPGWVLFIAKYAAMLGIAALLTGTLFLTGLSIQWLNGQTPIDWSLYANDLLIDGFLRYAQLIALAFLIQTLLPIRLLGHLAAVVAIGLLLSVDEYGLQGSWLAVYSSLPNSWAYSELTGYGNAGRFRWVYAAMWSVLAMGLLSLASGLVQRGVVVPMRVVVRRWQSGLRPGYVVWLAAVVAGVCIGQLYLRLPVNELADGADTASNAPLLHRTTQVVTVQNRPVTIHYHYVHSQNLARIQAMAAQTLQQATGWLGTFPSAELTIAEVPRFMKTQSASATRIDVNERDGWLTDTSDPFDAGQVDLTISKIILRHWVAKKRLTSAFIRQSLPDYLALRVVQHQRGDEWLATELARVQRACRTPANKSNVPDQVPALLTARGPLSLTCVGEVWGHDKLCRQIGSFVQAANPTDIHSFAESLTKALPDSLTYLGTYLSEQPTFDFRIGRIGTYPDRLSVKVRAHKYRTDSAGQLNEQLLNDYVPVVLLNAAGQVIYRQLILANTDGRTDKVDWLPAHPDAVAVIVDPLGAWPELNKRDNQKQLARL